MEKFTELDLHLMNDTKPSIYFEELRREDLFNEDYPFTLLGELIKVPQSPEHHPEGSVWNHTMLVVDNAAKRKHLSRDSRVFMWSALLHDLGKALTTKMRKGRITSYDHDKVGADLAVKFLRELTGDLEFIEKVSKMVRWHMQILFVVKGLPFADIGKMASEVSIDEIALLGLCDRLGRGRMTGEKQREEEETVMVFVEKCLEHRQVHSMR